MIDFDIYNKLLAILFSLFIFGQAFFIRIIAGTYIHPAAIFALAWFFYTFIPLVVMFKVPINPLSIMYVFICVLGFSISSLLFNWKYGYQVNSLKSDNKYIKYNTVFLNYSLYLSSILSVFFSFVSLKSQGFEVQFSLVGLLEASGQFAALSGHNMLISNRWGSVAIFFTYSSAILGGIVYRYKECNVKKIITLIFAFAPAIFFTITQSSKLITFYSIGFFMGSMLLMKINTNKLRIFEHVKVFKMFGIVSLLLVVVSFSILSRGSGYEGVSGIGDVVGRIYPTFMNYAFAQLYAFSDFFSYFLGMTSETLYADDYNAYGYYTFKGIFDSFGGEKFFPPTYYYEAYQYKDIVSTNIFTIFRGLIYDFGIIGSILVLVLMGFVAHLFFYMILVTKNTPVLNSLFIVMVVFIQGTYLMSIFTARYALLIFVIFGFIFYINDKIQKHKFVFTNKKLRNSV